MKCGYVSIIGRPNSGKSTLLNKILGESLSIVTHKAQTTRRKITGIHTTPEAQILFLDTPGYHESSKPLNQYMMDEVRGAIKDADVICWVVDGHSRESGNLEQTLDSCFRRNDTTKKLQLSKIIIAFNKCDLSKNDDLFKQLSDQYSTINISAKTGVGIDQLVNALIEKLPEGPPFYPDDIYTEHPVRFLVAEIIREQILNLMHQEIPYSIAVEIEDYKEEERIHRIQAAIIVDKESQKGMVIGTGGEMIKKIGSAARVKIESLVDCKVFLKLFVKVEKNWTKDPKTVKRILERVL